MAERRGFDLENRTTEFAKRVVRLCKKLPRDPMNDRMTGQLVGSAGSVGANYRKANDALGKKDFVYRLKIARKESKEANSFYSAEVDDLIRESTELRNIISAIITKTA